MRIGLLGGFRVSVEARTIEEDAWHLRKAASLLKLLALAPGHRLHREQAMDALWPDLAKGASSNNLRQALHAARRTLDEAEGSRYLASDNEALILVPEGTLRVDVDTFEEAAIAARRERFPSAYEATLPGAGGSGKTRLAVETARGLAGAYQDGVLLTELAALSEPGLVPQAVARALGTSEQPGHPLLGTLTEALRDKELLLVLDNCEHLIEASSSLAEMLLSSCPRLRILATSREPLAVGGEAVRQVGSLSLPETTNGGLPAEDLMGCEACACSWSAPALQHRASG